MMSTGHDPELAELRALRGEMTAALEVARSCAAQGLRIVLSRIGSGRDATEIRSWVRALAHAARIGLPDAAPVAVLGRASTGGDVLVLVADGTAVVRRLARRDVEDLMSARATVDEARVWVLGLDGLASEAEAIGIEDVAVMIAAIREHHGR